jgi:hypothetical protein
LLSTSKAWAQKTNATAFKAANSELIKVAMNCLELQLVKLDKQAEMYALARYKEEAKIVEQMKNQESIAATFRKRIQSARCLAHEQGFSTSIQHFHLLARTLR